MAKEKSKIEKDPPRPVTVDWVVSTYSIPRRSVYLLAREGLVEIQPSESGPAIRPEMVDRIRLILELKRDLGVNMAGVEIILRLRQQLLWYQRRHGRDFGEPCIDIDSVSS